MLRFSKKFALTGLLAVIVQGASAFSLLGPFDGWQTDVLSYNIGGDIGGPQQLGEEYRYNIPVLYYAADSSFLDFFGSSGMVAIDKATAILNSLSNPSSYSSNLTEFPLDTRRFNFRAQALNLIDLSSATLHILLEELGLAEPERYAWTLRARIGQCPAYTYFVTQRNFDPVSWEPTPYVNGTLYTYDIIEFCPVVDRADAFERRVDPLQHLLNAVASVGIFEPGSFHIGLTRDDFGGLRYLYRTNNVNLEESGPNTETFVTNNTPQLLTTSNLNFLAEAALTNNAAALQGLFPGLVVTSSSNFFTYVPVTNITATFTNGEPWAPAGTATLVLVTNVTFSFQQIFQHTFGNILTVQFTNGGPVVVPVTNIFSVSNRVLNTIQTISATFPPFTPVGTNTLPTTNITTRTFVTNQIAGEFFILPPGNCGVAILATLATNVVATTNIIVVSTNTFGATNVNGQFFSQTRVDFFTNHTFLTLPVICETTNLSLKQGIEKVTFVRRDYDSLLGRFFHPITNEYTLNSITNSTIVQHRVRRVITSPDILFTADDITDTALGYLRTTNNWVNNNVLSGLNGPGVIVPPKIVTFNKAGPLFSNEGPIFMDEASNERLFRWGFYDGTTNAPIVFPDGQSIMDLENQVLMRVTTATLPGGTNGVAFSAQLEGVGGQGPFTWSLAPGSAPLPAGLGVYSPDCDCWLLPPNGLIAGTPTIPGTYTFTVLMTDALNQRVTRDLTIIISP
jgi:hypothetical protein